jgi:signal transduction histidine kinase/CheY-like chemotaxis protein
LEDFPGPAFVLDGPEGRVGRHNAAFGAWAGLADAAGLALADLLPGDPCAVRLWDEARRTGAAEHHVERRGRDGECSFWSLRARRTPAGVLVCATDLTAVVSAAHAVHASSRDYVAVAAHELRAPLSAIKAWASALDARRASLDPLEADGLGAISRQVDRMNGLLTDLFDAARAGAGALRAVCAQVQVEALLRRALPGGGSSVEIAPDAQRVFVDAAQIEALIGRLLGWMSARRRTAPAATAAFAVREGPEVHLAFADLGPELTRRAEAELFGRTLRAGRGLGLYLCQHIAVANGGRVWRERRAGGARFVLALPVEPRPSSPCAGPGPARVLVGEAEPTRSARVLAALRLEGYVCDGAASGAALFRALDQGLWDVVVADLLALGAGGLADLRRIRERPAPPEVVVIAPSIDRPEVLDGAERAGALVVLSRPVDWAHLVSLVGCATAARLDTSR